jgi:hypothetical protein
MRAFVLFLALCLAAKSAAAEPLTLDRASLWASYLSISRKNFPPSVNGSTATYMAGVEGTFSALGRLLPAFADVRVADLLGVTIGGGNDGGSSDSGTLAGSVFDARAGLQLLYTSPLVDVGLQGGACLCGDFFTPSNRDIDPFFGARLRVAQVFVEGEHNEWGWTATVGFKPGRYRLGATLILPAKQSDYAVPVAATTSGVGGRAWLAIDL